MLEKINNITAGSDFKREARPSNFNSLLSSTYSRKIDLHDSVDISPAFKFLNQINWRIKEFKHVINDRVFLNFLASNIEFKTTIDLANLTELSNLNYLILKDIVDPVRSKKIVSDFSVKIDKIIYDQEPVLINFSALNIFFQRMLALNVYREITRNEKYFFDDLLEGIYYGLEDEMKHLNNHIFYFIEKLTGIRINKKNPSLKDYGEPVVIKKVKVLNDK